MRRAVIVLVAAAAAFTGAAPAGAAPVRLGDGQQPSLAIDPAGTAYVAWDGANVIGFCRLPRGAKACDARVDLAFEDQLAFNRRVTLLRRATDGALFVVAYRDEASVKRTVVFSSGDGGATWSGPADVATGLASVDRAALSADGATLLALEDAIEGLRVQAAPLGGFETRTLTFGDADDPSDLSVLPDGRVLVVSGSSTSRLRWRLFGGGDPFDATAWATSGSVRSLGDREARLASGPRGVFLLEQRSGVAQDLRPNRDAWWVRSFDTVKGRWRAARSANGDHLVFGKAAFSQDGGGRLHIIAANNNGARENCLLYARTGPRRSQWFGRTTVLYRTHSKARRPLTPRAAAAPDGKGVAVWSDSGGAIWATTLRQAKGKPRHIAQFRPRCVRE